MSRTAALGTTLAVLSIAAVALAGCSTTTASQAADSTQKPASQAPEPSPAPTSAAAAADACTKPASINLAPAGARVTGDLVDRGAREFAVGTVGRDNKGRIVSYTVAPNDVAAVVGERLCIENGQALSVLNHTRTIHPGQVLRLNPDPQIRYIPYYNPWNAPAGFKQIPYQEAIEAMGTAADEGDLETMRRIWTRTLSGMFTDPADIQAIQQALDAGDLGVLSQMFS
ncbi:hypothetical protein [Microbacterium capsulatum]|uniref:Lipoprotein n=1 Tax=Microbacterium capsulatum TaxID=3041921 RepID=A0ABU0XFQ6_9MICO|nr:hypothetical protein [Microbacterium sp. ASV81]MDQ4213961.1 hypothetical protein [Microbacterium sp. ASV81]